ncbi:MAG: lysophospholipid acyltransferase family protein [Anaerolineae bacterium]
MKASGKQGSAPPILIGVILARLMPRWLGYWIVRRGSSVMRAKRMALYSILRENLGHVDPQITGEALDDLAQRALIELGYTYFDMFHYRRVRLLQGKLLTYDPDEWRRARAQFQDPRGTIVVGAHIGNFDLAAEWFVSQGFELQALSLADPGGGTQVVNRFRRQRGLIVTPISVQALREALRRLRSGGVIITGVDRPASYDDPTTVFFGAPAPLPRGHVRLALQTDARVVVAYCSRQANGVYRLHISAPLDMVRTGDREADIALNTRRVLELVEDNIREDPAQWAMLRPVWSRPDE